MVQMAGFSSFHLLLLTVMDAFKEVFMTALRQRMLEELQPRNAQTRIVPNSFCHRTLPVCHHLAPLYPQTYTRT
jgi:hypothetical protein